MEFTRRSNSLVATGQVVTLLIYAGFKVSGASFSDATLNEAVQSDNSHASPFDSNTGRLLVTT